MVFRARSRISRDQFHLGKYDHPKDFPLAMRKFGLIDDALATSQHFDSSRPAIEGMLFGHLGAKHHC